MKESVLEHELRLSCRLLQRVEDAAPGLIKRMMGAYRNKSLKETIDDYSAEADRRVAELLARDRD